MVFTWYFRKYHGIHGTFPKLLWSWRISFIRPQLFFCSVYVLTSLSLFQSLGLRTTGAKKSMENIQLERERENLRNTERTFNFNGNKTVRNNWLSEQGREWNNWSSCFLLLYKDNWLLLIPFFLYSCPPLSLFSRQSDSLHKITEGSGVLRAGKYSLAFFPLLSDS